IEELEDAAGDGETGDDAFGLRHDLALGPRAGRHRRFGRHVHPSDVFGEEAAQERVEGLAVAVVFKRRHGSAGYCIRREPTVWKGGVWRAGGNANALFWGMRAF